MERNLITAGRAEDLFAKLQSTDAVLDLIGEAEDAHLDCKEWPSKEDDAQKMLAKAACGLTNADGGVLVIGMKAESRPKDEPDVVTAAAPVSDTSLVKSRVLGLISNLIEPGIVGIQAEEIATKPKSKSGFVVVYVPKSDGSPRRSRKDWKFYQRIGSATLPMEYWQIEVLFGKLPKAKLTLHLEPEEMRAADHANAAPWRPLTLDLRNEGTGIAKFSTIRFKRENAILIDSYGIDGNCGFGLPLRPSQTDWFVFRGGMDDVIFPGETLLISKLRQAGKSTGIGGIPVTMGIPIVHNRMVMERWVCEPSNFRCEISSEGVATSTLEYELPQAEYIAKLGGY
jgi:hypothetical protein